MHKDGHAIFFGAEIPDPIVLLFQSMTISRLYVLGRVPISLKWRRQIIIEMTNQFVSLKHYIMNKMKSVSAIIMCMAMSLTLSCGSGDDETDSVKTETEGDNPSKDEATPEKSIQMSILSKKSG